MRRLPAFPVLAVVASVAAAAPAAAAPVPFRIDVTHSEVSFSIRHFFSRVPGRFNAFRGTILLDEKNLASSSVEATIQAASIYTNDERRDHDLRSTDFFAVDSFPTITFRSTKVTPGEQGRLRIEGELTIRGVTKPVVLDGAFLGAGDIGIGGEAVGYRAGFEATTRVNRQDFNIRWNRTLDQGGTMLGDDVDIRLGIEAVRVEDGAAPPAKKR